jgi:hypothetical protein
MGANSPINKTKKTGAPGLAENIYENPASHDPDEVFDGFRGPTPSHLTCRFNSDSQEVDIVPVLSQQCSQAPLVRHDDYDSGLKESMCRYVVILTAAFLFLILLVLCAYLGVQLNFWRK